LSGSGEFYPDAEPTNPDGTYKRLVYNTINRLFYNKLNDPTKILGMEYIDFPLSQTVRNMAEDFRVFNVPQDVYGDKLVPGTIQLFDTSLDDNVSITDDGYQNLLAGYNLFSKIQEVRNFGNTLLTGNATASCPPYASILIFSNPSDQYTYVGFTASFSVSASSDVLPLYYQWISGSTLLSDNARITGSNTTYLQINNIQLSDSGSYRVLISNNETSVYSGTANLFVDVGILLASDKTPYILGPYDTFESYDIGSSPTNGGHGWDGEWIINPPGGYPYPMVAAQDNFDGTSDGWIGGWA
jgi:hypothetical protein